VLWTGVGGPSGFGLGAGYPPERPARQGTARAGKTTDRAAAGVAARVRQPERPSTESEETRNVGLRDRAAVLAAEAQG